MCKEVTLVIPVYNVKKYLPRCLNSIDQQTFKKFDIILVDDGSTDGSSEICDEYILKNTNAIVIHKKNEGLGMARNSGLDIATGKYIAFIDSDDYIESDYIERLYNDVQKHQADTCIGGFKRVYSNSAIEIPNPYQGYEFAGSEVQTKVLSKMFGRVGDDPDYLEMSVWKALFSNSIIQSHNIRFPSERVFISEDIIFDTEYFRYSEKVYMSDANGYCYCDNEGSLTTRYRPDRFERQIFLYKELKKRSEDLGIFDLVRQRMMTTVVSIARYCIKLEVKYNDYSTALKNINKICNDDDFRNIIEDYNEDNVKGQSKIINFLMRNKCVYLLYVVSEFKLLIGA